MPDQIHALLPIIASVLIFLAIVLALDPLLRLWDAMTLQYVNSFTVQMKSVSMDTSKLHITLRWWGMGVFLLLFGLGFALGMLPVAITLTILLVLAPNWYLAGRLAKQRALLRDQISGASTALANTARAGLALAQGLEEVARESPAPLGRELSRIVSEYQSGMPLAESINATKERLKLDSFSIFAIAITTCLEHGGRITHTLEKISQSLAENQRLERKLEAETASGRRVVKMLSLFPLGFLGLFAFLYPSGTALLFTTTIGQVMLAGTIMLVVASFLWSQKILDIKF